MSSTAVNGGGSQGGRPPGKSRGGDHLATLVGPLASAAGVDLEGVEVLSAGRRRVVRIFVDKNGGVSLDEVAKISTAISARLDETDALGGSSYVLEVSSPGVDRPLTAPRHWRRATGRLVRTTMIEGGELACRVVDADEEGVTLEIDSVPTLVRYSEIANAQVEVEFNRPAAANEQGEEV